MRNLLDAFPIKPARLANLSRQLWSDECGSILSAELVLVGGVVLVGATAGLKSVVDSVNDELFDLAVSIRSLDQSYEVAPIKMTHGWVAGSSFQQTPVAESINELETNYLVDRAYEKVRREALLEELREAVRKGVNEPHEPDFSATKPADSGSIGSPLFSTEPAESVAPTTETRRERRLRMRQQNPLIEGAAPPNE